MGPKHAGELWVYIGTPLPNPSGNAGVMFCMFVVKGSRQTVKLGNYLFICKTTLICAMKRGLHYKPLSFYRHS